MASLDNWKGLWRPLVSGLFIIACFPPFRLGLLVFVALVPWLVFLREASGKRAFRSGMLFGFIFWLGEFSFVAGFVGRWTGSLALGFVPYVLGCFLGSFYFALFGWLANICYRRSCAWAIPLAWAGVEIFRSYIIGLAFPFGLLASPLTSIPALIQSAHYGSVYLTSAWVLLANIVAAELLCGTTYLRIRWYAFAFVGVTAISVGRFVSDSKGAFHILVAGQPGVDMAYGAGSDTADRIARAIDVISDRAHGAELLVLPEGVVHAGDTLPPPTLFRVDATLPVVFGGQRGESPAYQSAFSYDGHWESADKTRLVIFGEYVPFRNYLPFLDKFNLPGGDLKPADKVTSLHAGKFVVGGSLCFEALFPDVSYKHALNGANLLAVMSIDDWYFGTNAPEQLRDASNWRAVETGLPLVRAASLGYSMIVDQRGRTVAEAPLGTLQTLTARVQVPDRSDVFPLFPVFPYLSLASLLAIPLYDTTRRRREKSR